MAGEIQTSFTTGKTVYSLIRNSVGQIWNGSAFVTYATLNYATLYPISLTEQSASALYAGSFPSTIVPGTYSVIAKQQLGGSPAETDPTIGVGNIEWGGSALVPLSDLATSGQIGQNIPQRVARGTMIKPFPFKMVSSLDHVTPFTSGVLSGQISRDGGVFGTLQSGAFTEIGLGFYQVQALTSGDLLGNAIALSFSALGISGGVSDSRDFVLLTQRVSGQL